MYKGVVRKWRHAIWINFDPFLPSECCLASRLKYCSYKILIAVKLLMDDPKIIAAPVNHLVQNFPMFEQLILLKALNEKTGIHFTKYNKDFIFNLFSIIYVINTIE